MQSMSKDSLSYYPLKVLHYSRLSPWDTSTKSKIFLAFNLTLLLGYTILATTGVVKSYDTDIIFTIESLQTCILLFHTMAKQMIIMSNKTLMVSLIERTASFWKVSEKYRGIFEMSRKLICAILVQGAIVCACFVSQPFITGSLPTVCYEPEGWRNILIGSFWYLSSIMYASILGFNTFYLSLCQSSFVQLKMLKTAFEELDFTKRNQAGLKRELKRLVRQHNFLLDFCGDINRLMKSVFLMESGLAVAAGCLSLFMAMRDDVPFGNKTKCCVYFVSQLSQTALYCFTAELLTGVSLDVGDAAYNSNWYDIHSSGLKKTLVLVIGRSQRVLSFDGHGIVYINLATLTSVYKTIMSFYTYLGTIDDKEE